MNDNDSARDMRRFVCGLVIGVPLSLALDSLVVWVIVLVVHSI
jgi:hypothetical protein